MSEKDEPRDEFYKCIKVPIKHVIKNPDINLPKLIDAVARANKIVTHTLLFMKLYLLKQYKKHNTIPTINKELINSSMKILCNDANNGRPPKDDIVKLKKKLTNFYEKHYKPLIPNENLDYTHMNTILDYLTVSIITMYENNIRLHYVEYIERYVNVIWQKKMLIDKIKKIYKTKKEREHRKNLLCAELRKIKNDILNIENTNYKSKQFYHNWINEQKKFILPNKKTFSKNSLYYDLQCNPLDYFNSMIFMMKKVEEYKVMIYNVFPMRNDIIPKHIRLDTTSLIHLLITKKQGNKSDYLFKGNLKRNENKLWEFFFRTERQCFNKPNYTFHHMIETDGVSCSIILIRNDMIGRRIKHKIKTSGEKYIDELDNYDELKNKKIVGIDPGVNSLITCVNEVNKDADIFRYTQNQRRKETKIKKFNKLILELKKEKINKKTIIDYETELSTFNKKTLHIKKFKKYITKKIEINKKLSEFYSRYVFRKLKLNGYINRKKNEQKMINNFNKIFGSPANVIVAIGDFEQKKHMKYKEATKGKGLRTLLRKSGYKVYLVDEFRTSCKCCQCEGGECKNIVTRPNPKPNKDNTILIHTLLHCQNEKCGVWWNRDCNGAKNIYKIAYNAIHNIERPKYLCREINQALITTSPKPKFTRHAKAKP